MCRNVIGTRRRAFGRNDWLLSFLPNQSFWVRSIAHVENHLTLFEDDRALGHDPPPVLSGSPCGFSKQ
jgi:hypothetical protein